MFDGVVAAVLLVGFLIHRATRPPAERSNGVWNALWQIPPQPIATLRDGVARMVGRVQPHGEARRGPLTQRPCVGFDLVVQERRGGGWTEILVRRDLGPFLVSDGASTALVEPEGHFGFALAASPEPDVHPTVRWCEAAGAEIETLRALLKVDGTWTDPAADYRYCETRLETGATVTVRGHAQRDFRPVGERSDLREPPELVVFRGSSTHRVLISDDERLTGGPQDEP